MTITKGEKLPEATLLSMTDEGPNPVSVSALTAGRKVVIFGLPGAFTGVCSTAHVPSFIRTHEKFAEKGVDEIVCVSVNDPFVMGAWAKDTGADAAGLTFLGDPLSQFTKAIGMEISMPAVGMLDRSKRYAMYVVDGVVEVLNVEDNPGICEMSAGEGLLESI